MNDLIQAISFNLKQVGIATIILALAMLSNMSFSIYHNLTICKEKFNFKKLFKGVFKLIALGLGLTFLVVDISVIPTYLTYIKFGDSDTTDFINTGVNVVLIISLFINAVKYYITQSYETLKNILNAKETDKTNKH